MSEARERGTRVLRSIAAGVALSAILLLVFGRVVRAIDNLLLDSVISWEARLASDVDVPFVLVEIDDVSIGALGRFPWSRELHAELVRRAARAGASAIGIDVLLIEPADSAGDAAFADALEEAGNVVLASAGELWSPTSSEGGSLPTPADPALAGLYRATELLEPLPRFAERAGAIGSIAVVEDSDGSLRSYPLLMNHGGTAYPSFVQALAEVSAGQVRGAVPLKGDGTFRINYASVPVSMMSPGSPVRIPFSNVLDMDEVELRSRFAGKIALVIASYTGGVDVGQTPLDPRTPYGLAHAYALQTIVSADHLRPLPWSAPLAFAVGFIVLLSMTRRSEDPIRLIAMGVGLAAVSVVAGVALLLVGGLLFPPTLPALASVLFVTGVSALEWRGSQLARHRAEAFLSRFLGAKMTARLGGDAHTVAMSRQLELTVMFCDLADFTRFANDADPDQIVSALRIFDEMALGVVHETGGVVDKLLGDGFLAYWGYPDTSPSHPATAVTAAKEIRKGMRAVNERLRQEGMPAFKIRIGLASGEVTLGEIGDDRIADFTIIGRPVNLAARLEALAPPDGIAIGAHTFRRATKLVATHAHEQEPVQVRGFTSPVPYYLVVEPFQRTDPTD